MLRTLGKIVDESEKSFFTKVRCTSRHSGIPLDLDELHLRKWITFEVQKLNLLLLELLVDQFCKQIKGKPDGFVRRCLVWVH